jgi:hypothetical protein
MINNESKTANAPDAKDAIMSIRIAGFDTANSSNI